MKQPSLHDYYLETMGIPRWRLRQQPPEEAVAEYVAYCYQLSNADIKGLFIADCDAQTEQALQQETELLQAICRAIKMQFKGERIFYSDSNFLDSQAYDFVILLGLHSQNNLAARASANSQLVIQSHALSQLLQNPKLKADTWRELQSIVALIKQSS